MTNNRTFLSLLTLVVLSIFLLVSCQKEEENRLIPIQVDALFSADEAAILDKHLDVNKFKFLRNTSNEEQYKIFLGRALFYDKNLSGDRSVSCESCHQQQLAFSDNIALSTGANNNATDRNSIALVSVSSFIGHYGGEEGTDIVENSFFWDNRTETLEEQLTQTLANPNEMDMKFHQLAPRVNELEYARVLYQKAYGNTNISSENIVESIAAFVNSLNSQHAPFDHGLGQAQFKVFDDFPLYSEEQNRGKTLFLQNCASCHAFSLSPTLRHQFENMETAASNGLDITYADKGVARATLLKEDEGVFKIPGLRNVGMTGPYMHDGRFETLEEVIDFYSQNIQPTPNLSDKLMTEDGQPKRMNFTEQDRTDLIAFLHTLSGITHNDEEFSNPFRK